MLAVGGGDGRRGRDRGDGGARGVRGDGGGGVDRRILMQRRDGQRRGLWRGVIRHQLDLAPPIIVLMLSVTPPALGRGLVAGVGLAGGLAAPNRGARRTEATIAGATRAEDGHGAAQGAGLQPTMGKRAHEPAAWPPQGWTRGSAADRVWLDGRGLCRARREGSGRTSPRAFTFLAAWAAYPIGPIIAERTGRPNRRPVSLRHPTSPKFRGSS